MCVELRSCCGRVLLRGVYGTLTSCTGLRLRTGPPASPAGRDARPAGHNQAGLQSRSPMTTRSQLCLLWHLLAPIRPTLPEPTSAPRKSGSDPMARGTVPSGRRRVTGCPVSEAPGKRLPAARPVIGNTPLTLRRPARSVRLEQLAGGLHAACERTAESFGSYARRRRLGGILPTIHTQSRPRAKSRGDCQCRTSTFTTDSYAKTDVALIHRDRSRPWTRPRNAS